MKEERLKLDRRIHNQRRALRENWEILEMRNGHRMREEVRSRMLKYWCAAAGRVNELEAKLRKK